MTAPSRPRTRLRAYLIFLAAFLYLFVARSIAHRGALGYASDAWSPLVEQAMLVFLLVIGYAAMGFWIDRQPDPVREQGLTVRSGWLGEAGVGIATGWALAVVCVLLMMIVGGIAMEYSRQLASWGWLLADIAFFALATLAEEVAFRGYPFQCFVRAVGPVGATLGFAAIYAILQQLLLGSSRASFFVALAFTILLSSAYLRTRALWVSWGINFGWKASRAVLFGLAVNGVGTHSSIVQGDPMGPFWLTGGAFGLEGSWLAFFVLLAALPVVFRITRDLNYRYNTPVIIPGGIPVDLDAAARAQHDAAMASPVPSAPQFVPIAQIGSASPSPIVPAHVPPGSDPNHS
jgi:uncharacterized protein